MNIERKREPRITNNKELISLLTEEDIKKAKAALDEYYKKLLQKMSTRKNDKIVQLYEKALKRHNRKLLPRCTFVPVAEIKVDLPNIWCIQALMCVVCKKIKIVPRRYYWKNVASTAD